MKYGGEGVVFWSQQMVWWLVCTICWWNVSQTSSTVVKSYKWLSLLCFLLKLSPIVIVVNIFFVFFDRLKQDEQIFCHFVAPFSSIFPFYFPEKVVNTPPIGRSGIHSLRSKTTPSPGPGSKVTTPSSASKATTPVTKVTRSKVSPGPRGSVLSKLEEKRAQSVKGL